MSKVLLVDDDIELTEMLAEYLGTESFEIDIAHDGQAALDKAKSNSYDLIILDVMMPKLNGFDALRKLRKHSSVPVIMLTARGDDVDSVAGLEIGADDYLSKPCNPRVLVAHMRAILRRTEQMANGATEPAAPVSGKIAIGDIELDQGARQVSKNGEAVNMTSTEYSVLETLVQHAGQVVSKEQLSENALGRKHSLHDRSLDMHISNLRKKLGSLPDQQERIITVRGHGYQYTQQAPTNLSQGDQ